MTEPEHQPEVRSSVKIDENAKGYPQLKIAIYEGTSDDEAQRIKDLAIRTFEVGRRELNQKFGNVQ